MAKANEVKLRSCLILVLVMISLSPPKSSAAAESTPGYPVNSLFEVHNTCRDANNPIVQQLCRLMLYMSNGGGLLQQQQRTINHQAWPAGSHDNYMMMPRGTRSIAAGEEIIANSMDSSGPLFGDLMETVALGSDAPTWALPRIGGDWQPMRGKRKNAA